MFNVDQLPDGSVELQFQFSARSRNLVTYRIRGKEYKIQQQIESSKRSWLIKVMEQITSTLTRCHVLSLPDLQVQWPKKITQNGTRVKVAAQDEVFRKNYQVCRRAQFHIQGWIKNEPPVSELIDQVSEQLAHLKGIIPEKSLWKGGLEDTILALENWIDQEKITQHERIETNISQDQ